MSILANELYRKGSFDLAIIEYLKVNNYYNAGVCAYKINSKKDALVFYAKSIVLREYNNGNNYYNFANTITELYGKEDAKDYWLMALYQTSKVQSCKQLLEEILDIVYKFYDYSMEQFTTEGIDNHIVEYCEAKFEALAETYKDISAKYLNQLENSEHKKKKTKNNSSRKKKIKLQMHKMVKFYVAEFKANDGFHVREYYKEGNTIIYRMDLLTAEMTDSIEVEFISCKKENTKKYNSIKNLIKKKYSTDIFVNI